MTLLLAIAAGALIGLSLGALGGGGSILAVPVLVYLLGQDAGQATTGSLVVVGVIGGLMALRQFRHARRSSGAQRSAAGGPGSRRPTLDDPIIAFREGFMCDCPRAVKVLVTATAVGLLTGFLGVGGGFLVVPALVLALALPMRHAAGTSPVRTMRMASATTTPLAASLRPTLSEPLVIVYVPSDSQLMPPAATSLGNNC